MQRSAVMLSHDNVSQAVFVCILLFIFTTEFIVVCINISLVSISWTM